MPIRDLEGSPAAGSGETFCPEGRSPRHPALPMLHEQHVESLCNQLLLLPASLVGEVAQLLECSLVDPRGEALPVLSARRHVGLGSIAFGRSDLALGEARQGAKDGATVPRFLFLDHGLASRALRFGLASAVDTLARRSRKSHKARISLAATFPLAPSSMTALPFSAAVWNSARWRMTCGHTVISNFSMTAVASPMRASPPALSTLLMTPTVTPSFPAALSSCT